MAVLKGVLPFLGVREEPSTNTDRQKDHGCSDQRRCGPDEDDNVKDKDGRDKDRSKVAESSHAASSDSEKSMEPEPSRSARVPPKDSTPDSKSSASARRALFARRRLDASASASSGGCHSPPAPSSVPQREPSPPRSPSPRPRQSPAPPSSLSPSSCHVSTSAPRPTSPVRGLSPIIVPSHGSESSGPPGSLADTSAQCHACLHPRERPSTARLVSHFSFCFKKNKKTWWHNIFWSIWMSFLHLTSPSLLFLSQPESVTMPCFCPVV